MDHLKQTELQTLSSVLRSSFLAAFDFLHRVLNAQLSRARVAGSSVDIRKHPCVAEVLFLQIAGISCRRPVRETVLRAPSRMRNAAIPARTDSIPCA
jgi:hypothetical protein